MYSIINKIIQRCLITKIPKIKGFALLLITFFIFKNTYNQELFHICLKIYEYNNSTTPIKLIKKAFSDTLSRNLYINKTINDIILQQHYNYKQTIEKKDSNNLLINIYKNKKFAGILIINDTISNNELNHDKIKAKPTFIKMIKPEKFEKFISAILLYYENRGFPFVEIKLNNIKCNDSLCSTELILDKKNLYTFDSIKLTDSTVVDKYFIEKTLKFSKKELYQQKKISRIPELINNLPFLSTENDTKIKFTQSTYTINLDIKEKKANSIDGIIGFYTDAENGKVKLTGDIKASLCNSLKTGELIDFQWQSFATQSQQLNSTIMFPYFLKTDFGIMGKLELMKKDTSFSANTKRLGIQYQFYYWNYVQIYLETSESVVTGNFSNITNNTNNAFYNYKTLLFGTEFKYEAIDNRICPTKGYFVTIDLANGIKNKLLKKNNFINAIDSNKLQTTYRKLTSKIEGYLPIYKRNIIKLANYSGWIFDNQLAKNELYRLGGFKTLRGFDELSIWASAYSIFGIEYRYLFEKNSYFNIFSDAGYCEANTYINFNTLIPVSIGAGINFETQLGIFSLYYALGKQNQQPFLFKNAKIHFGLSSKF